MSVPDMPALAKVIAKTAGPSICLYTRYGGSTDARASLVWRMRDDVRCVRTQPHGHVADDKKDTTIRWNTTQV